MEKNESHDQNSQEKAGTPAPATVPGKSRDNPMNIYLFFFLRALHADTDPPWNSMNLFADADLGSQANEFCVISAPTAESDHQPEQPSTSVRGSEWGLAGGSWRVTGLKHSKEK